MTDAGDSVENLVFQCLEAEDLEAELDRQCAAHPEIAGRLRRIVHQLAENGLVETQASTAAVPAVIDEELQIPERLGDFRLIRRLGAGGMGIVYLAEETALGRNVALKLVRPEQLYFQGARERFRREAEAIARLQHPGIVAIHSVGEERGLPFFSMEYVKGETLSNIVARLSGRDPSQLQGRDLLAQLRAEPRSGGSSSGSSPIDPQGSWVVVVLHVVNEIAKALEHAHGLGVLHRDVKPSNVILTEDARPRLLDFGLARSEQDQEITRTTSHLGSLPYMTPEQVSGRMLAPTSSIDVYALGVTMYELLTLHSPFLAENAEETRRRILQGECPRMRSLNPSVSWEVETVCATAMEFSPARRYPLMSEFRADLENLLARRPIHARPMGPLLRTFRWIQRHPTATVALFMGGLLLVLAVYFADYQRRAAIESRERSYVLGITAADSQLREVETGLARRSLDLCPQELRRFEWHHLALRGDASQRIYRGHEGGIEAMDIHPDGTRFATGAGDGTVRFWRVGNTEAEKIVQFRRESPEDLRPLVVSAIHYSTDGARVFAAFTDGRFVSLRSDGSDVHAFPSVATVIVRLQTDPRSDRLLGGTREGSILLFDSKTGDVVQEVCHKSASRIPVPIHAFAFADDTRTLYASRGSEILRYRRDGDRFVQEPCDWRQPPQDWALLLIPLPGGDLLSAGMYGRLHRWHPGSGKTVDEERGNGRAVKCGVLAHGGEMVLLADAKGPITARRIDDLSIVQTLQGHDDNVREMVLTPDGNTLFTASIDGTVREWSTDLQSTVREVIRHEGAIRSLEFTADGERILTGSSDGILRVTDLRTGASRVLLERSGARLGCLDPSPDGTQVLVAAGTVDLVDPDSDARHELPDVGDAHLARWTSDGIVVAHGDHHLSLRVGADHRQVRAVTEALPAVACLKVSPFTGEILAGCVGGAIFTWNGTATAPRRVGTHDKEVVAIAFDVARGRVVTGDTGGTIRFFDRSLSEEVRPPIEWVRNLNSISFHPHEARMVTTAMRNVFQLWDADTLQPILAMRGHRRAVFDARFTPRGDRLISISWDGCALSFESQRR